jgi:hypothetical protein
MYYKKYLLEFDAQYKSFHVNLLILMHIYEYLHKYLRIRMYIYTYIYTNNLIFLYVYFSIPDFHININFIEFQMAHQIREIPPL